MTYTPIFTASEIERLMQCSGSASLIRLDTYSQAGQAGTNDHARYLKPGGLPQNCRQWLIGGNPQNAPKSPLDRYEASFEYDTTTNTGKWLGSNLGHSAGHVSKPGLTRGTCDVWNWWIDQDGLHVRVADLKTGFMQVAGDLPEAFDSWQLRWYTLAGLASLRTVTPTYEYDDFIQSEAGNASIGDGYSRSQQTALLCTQLPLASCRVAFFTPNALGEIDIRPAHRDFTQADLVTFQHQLDLLAQRIQKQAGAIWRTGPWCGRCPGLHTCPIYKGIVDQLGVACDGPVTDRTIVELWRLTKHIKPVIETAEALVSNKLLHGPLETRPGYVLGHGKEITRPSVAPDAVVLARSVLDNVPTKEVLDLEAINDMPIDQRLPMMKALVEVGAVRISKFSTVGERRVKGV